MRKPRVCGDSHSSLPYSGAIVQLSFIKQCRLVATLILEKSEFLTVTDFWGVDIGIHQAMRRSISFATNKG